MCGRLRYEWTVNMGSAEWCVALVFGSPEGVGLRLVGLYCM